MNKLTLISIAICFSFLIGCGPSENEDFFSDDDFAKDQFVKEVTPQEKIDQYKQILEIDPDDYQIRNNLGVVYAKLKLFDEAIAEFQKVMELKPEYTTVWLNMGSTYGDMGNLDEAIKCYLKAIELNPGYVKVYQNLGVAYFQKKQYKEAIEGFEKFVELNNGQADESTFFSLAESYKEIDDRQNTVKYYNKILKMNPNNEYVRKELEKLTQQDNE